MGALWRSKGPAGNGTMTQTASAVIFLATICALGAIAIMLASRAARNGAERRIVARGHLLIALVLALTLPVILLGTLGAVPVWAYRTSFAVLIFGLIASLLHLYRLRRRRSLLRF